MKESRRTRIFRALVPLSFAVALLASGCAQKVPYHHQGQEGVYTLTNLHPDEVRARLYSVNYQQRGLIPVCTPVRIEKVSNQEMRFTRLDTGQPYQYVFHNAVREPIPVHLDKYFGTECPDLEAMSGVDAEGIEQARVMEGMSKQAVILAIGYPPSHETPSLDHDVWKYWKNKFDTFLVHFQDGRVVRIQD
ncbi:MAG: hypothetical protein ACODAG_01395 [Myxococcota bacterium]